MGLLFKVGMLAGVVYLFLNTPRSVSKLGSAFWNARSSIRTSSKMGALRQALALTYVNDERFPTNLGDFAQHEIQDVDNPALDGWGTPFVLVGGPPNTELVSCGPDGVCGTEDDVHLRILPQKRTRAEGM